MSRLLRQVTSARPALARLHAAPPISSSSLLFPRRLVINVPASQSSSSSSSSSPSSSSSSSRIWSSTTTSSSSSLFLMRNHNDSENISSLPPREKLSRLSSHVSPLSSSLHLRHHSFFSGPSYTQSSPFSSSSSSPSYVRDSRGNIYASIPMTSLRSFSTSSSSNNNSNNDDDNNNNNNEDDENSNNNNQRDEKPDNVDNDDNGGGKNNKIDDNNSTNNNGSNKPKRDKDKNNNEDPKGRIRPLSPSDTSTTATDHGGADIDDVAELPPSGPLQHILVPSVQKVVPLWPTDNKVVVYPLFSTIYFPGHRGVFHTTPEQFLHLQNQGLTSRSNNSGGGPATAPPGYEQEGVAFVGLFLLKEEFRVKLKTNKLFALTREMLHDVGVLAQIYKSNQYYSYVTTSVMKITDVVQTKPSLVVKIEKLKMEAYDKKDPDVVTAVSSIVQVASEFEKKFPESMYGENGREFRQRVPSKQPDPAALIDLVIHCFGVMNPNEAQTILQTTNIREKLKIVMQNFARDNEMLDLQLQIAKQLGEKMGGDHRNFFLMEQLKTIRKELGLEQDEKELLIQIYHDRLKTLTVPPATMKVINDEMNKLQTLETASMEYSGTKNYLEWLTSLPWGVYSQENFDLQHARKVLEEDHHGLKDIKQRILEFIAVGHLKGTVQGKIICLIGPPGTGKTSIGKSIARALSREFYRFSVGGMSDVSEIKGHRRTYVGAMPGKLLQCMKTVKKANPVILIDEIDKLGKGHQGDPASALLEVLDPEQNKNFMDHYLDTPYDLGRVLFICTANMKDPIPKPLLDRMEVMHLSGYILNEQVTIVNKYLIPAAREAAGLKVSQCKISAAAVRKMVTLYCREAGVRLLQKLVERIMRKVAIQVVRKTKGKAEKGKPLVSYVSVSIDEHNLESYLGKPIYTSDRYYERTPLGVVMGLAWTANGGATLYVETAVDSQSRKAELRTTGQMGDVMKESTSIAYTYAKNHIERVSPGNRFFEGAALHMHIPEGATPKDGPSAGCAMVTSLLSQALNKHVTPNLAMTGEVTLTGKVLSIGGVKEKTIAAKRSGVKHILLPQGNRKDFEELADHIREGLIVHYVDYYDDVYKVALEGKLDVADEEASKAVSKKKKKKASTKKTKTTQKKKKDDDAPINIRDLQDEMIHPPTEKDPNPFIPTSEDTPKNNNND